MPRWNRPQRVCLSGPLIHANHPAGRDDVLAHRAQHGATPGRTGETRRRVDGKKLKRVAMWPVAWHGGGREPPGP